MKLVRKRLSASEVIPSNLRYNSGTDTVQFSPDGGTTWVDSPSADPRHGDAFRLPARTGSDPQCDAAANMVKWLKDFIDMATEALGAGAEAFTLVNLAIPIYELISGGTLTLLGLITEVGEGLFSIGYTALLAAFTSDQYDLLQCIFYCNEGAGGSVSAEAMPDIAAQVTAQLNTTAGIVVNAILGLQGEVGLSNAGAIGSEVGDCSSCSCLWHYQWVGDEVFNAFTYDSSIAETTGHLAAGPPAGAAGNYTGHGTGGLPNLYDVGRKSASFDLTSAMHITSMSISMDAAFTNVGSHLELWCGANRTAGLAHSERIYQTNWNIGANITPSGDITNASSQTIAYGFADGGNHVAYQIDIYGNGDEPAFTGGNFV